MRKRFDNNVRCYGLRKVSYFYESVLDLKRTAQGGLTTTDLALLHRNNSFLSPQTHVIKRFLFYAENNQCPPQQLCSKPQR